MNLPSLLVLTTGAIVLAGCSSTPAKLDSGAIHAQTFSFVTQVAKPSPDYVDGRQIIHPMVQGAIARNLTARGLTQVASGGDVTVSYLIITGNNASTASIDDYFGYREDAYALHEKAHKAYTGSKNPNYFEAGTLLIDIIDTKSFKLLKRNYATRPILRNLPNDARVARIQELVDEIFRDVRVAP